MIVTINGDDQPLATGASIHDVVTSLVEQTRGVAVAVNGAMVPKSEWSNRLLVDGDRVEVLTAAAGG